MPDPRFHKLYHLDQAPTSGSLLNLEPVPEPAQSPQPHPNLKDTRPPNPRLLYHRLITLQPTLPSSHNIINSTHTPRPQSHITILLPLKIQPDLQTPINRLPRPLHQHLLLSGLLSPPPHLPHPLPIILISVVVVEKRDLAHGALVNLLEVLSYALHGRDEGAGGGDVDYFGGSGAGEGRCDLGVEEGAFLDLCACRRGSVRGRGSCKEFELTFWQSREFGRFRGRLGGWDVVHVGGDSSVSLEVLLRRGYTDTWWSVAGC
jgi:hypothetical protein